MRAGKNLEKGDVVEVYRNLHRRCWSVRHKGLVVAHCQSIDLRNAQFIVRQSGRNKVLRTKRKNVHAFVKGELESMTLHDDKRCTSGMIGVSYNPYKTEWFIRTDNGMPIHHASAVHLSHPRVYLPGEQ
jgi:hypothetical protein